MFISIITLFKELYVPFLNTSLIKRAIDNNLIQVNLKTLFDFAKPKERIDSPAFGHGTGMLIKPEIMQKAIDEQESLYGHSFKIFFSPHGKKIDQFFLKKLFHQISKEKHLMLLPARYEGMDSRVEEHYADCIISIGDYVLMGGDLPAMVLMEGLLRFFPDVVGKESSVQKDSFTGAFVDYPQYTEPVDWNGYKVPDVIRSGNHGKIDEWRLEASIERTVYNHFNWMRSHLALTDDIKKIAKHIPPHYVVLMHDQVLLFDGKEGTSSVTSLDIHDIARSAKTFGLKKYFIVTPLIDQQKIVKTLLDFWIEGEGIEYNVHRHEAIKNVTLVSSLEEVLKEIEQLEGQKPLIIGTSAKSINDSRNIGYNDQEYIWKHHRPVLLVLGTARGLGSSIIDRCDYLLEPILGFSEFNHLSVRSAAAIIFDRWLGINSAKKFISC